MKLLYISLYKNIPNLEESIYKEDILQSAYICLLNHIDIYNPFASNSSFRQFFWNYTANKIIKKAISVFNNSLNEDFNTMLTTKAKLEQLGEFTTGDLSKEAGLRECRIDELMVLEQILNVQSLDEKIVIPVDDCYDEVYQKILKELLILILDTLPNEMQKDIVMKYYGLDGGIPQSFEQIALDLGISNRQRVQQISGDAHKNLQNSIRAKYIKELVEGYSLISLGDELDILPIDEQSLEYERLELYLMKQMPQEQLLELINNLDVKYREILISYFEFSGYTNMTNEEKSQKIGIGYKKYLELKHRGLLCLRSLIKRRYLLELPNENTNTVLDYLMYNYLHKYKKKIREK